MPLPGLGEKMNPENRKTHCKNYKWNGRVSFIAALLKANFRPDYFKNRHLRYQSFKLAFDFSHWALWRVLSIGFTPGIARTECPYIPRVQE